MIVKTDIYSTAELTERVGQSMIQVKNMTGAGVEPHDFEPSPRQLTELYRTGVFIYSSAGMAPWISRVLPALRQSGGILVDSSRGILLLTLDTGRWGARKIAAIDPHIWLDPVLAKRQVDNITEGLGQADPAHRRLYAMNAGAYKSRLDRLDADFRQGLARCRQRSFITTHAAFGYLAHRYGLQQVSIAGLTPDEEPSPRQLASIARFAKSHGVRYIFTEPLSTPRLAATVAREVDARLLPLNPIESLTDKEIAAGKDYLTIQRENLDHLRKALDCQ